MEAGNRGKEKEITDVWFIAQRLVIVIIFYIHKFIKLFIFEPQVLNPLNPEPQSPVVKSEAPEWAKLAAERRARRKRES